MVHKKSGSHRQTLKDKYKIQKKVKEHRKKLNKMAKSNPNFANKKLKRDPGVPNLWPFKEKLLRQEEMTRERAEEQKVRLRQQRMTAIARARARSSQPQTEQKQEVVYKSLAEKDFAQRRWYFRELNKVIDQADVILEVLDARDPIGCRCLEIERRILAHGSADSAPKKLVLILNKIDLVPPEVATKWVTHFRREFPTIAFKASTQQQSTKLSQTNVKLSKVDDAILQTGGAIGAGALMSLLKNYARSNSIKKQITVGCIGFPNVGKSSIVNSLKRSKAAGVSSSAGHTKVLQTIKLDHHINLLDSPGVLFAQGESQADLVLRNCVKVEQMEDPLAAVIQLVAKVPKESLLEIYRIADFNSPQQFVMHVAHKRGKLKAGGVPNMPAAAITILKDWTSGAIPFYTLPPAAPVADEKHESKTIVSGFGASFDIEKLLDEHQTELTTLDAPTQPNFIQMEPSAALKVDEAELAGEATMGDEDEDCDDDDEEEDEDDDDDGMMDDGEEAAAASTGAVDMSRIAKKSKKKGSAVAVARVLDPSQQKNKAIKKTQKKGTKKKNKLNAAMKM